MNLAGVLQSFLPCGCLEYKRPFFVCKNFSRSISSCFRKPVSGKLPLLTSSITAQAAAAVVQEIARQW